MLRLRDVKKSYRMGDVDVHALRGVTIEIAAGDFVAIMGPSGSGKSTLMHLLGLLDVPDSGTYEVDGRPAQNLGEDELAVLRRDVFGFVFQQFHLLKRLTARDNVALPLVYSRRNPDGRPEDLLGNVGLAERLVHRPQELSGGQQQRVAIARSLVNQPRVVLADEPTGDLDSVAEAEILDLFARLNEQGITIIVVTHEEEVALRARRVIRMRDGHVQSDERRRPVHIPTHAHAPPPAARLSAWVSEAREYLRQGAAVLRANKVRTALSTLGILMGVASVVTMLALGNGARRDVETQIASMGSNLLVLKTGAIRVGAVSQETGTVTRITVDDVAELRSRVALVRRASAVVEGKIQATYLNRNWQTRIVGTEPPFERIRAVTPQLGRYFTDEENAQRSRVAVIGTKVAGELFGRGVSPIGERIRLNRVSFQVIGILPPKGNSGWQDEDDVILIPVQTAMHRVLGKDFLDSVDIEVSEVDRIPEASRRIVEVMTARHRVGETRFPHPFEVRNMAKVKEALSQSSRILSWLLASIAAISLLVGGIGIMNIMLVTVTERTAEIGLRKAIGARRSDILAQFLAESVMNTFVGGCAGIVVGVVGSWLISLITGWTTQVTPGSIGIAFLFSVTIGLVFGVYPARRASELHPIAALRHG